MMVPAWRKVDFGTGTVASEKDWPFRCPDRHQAEHGLKFVSWPEHPLYDLYQKIFIVTQIVQTAQKRRPSAPMQTAAFGFTPYSISQSLKILSSSLSMVPALANSSVSA